MANKYRIPVKFQIQGTIEVIADNAKEAKKSIRRDVGLCLGGDIHTSNSNVDDWTFPIHFNKKIGQPKTIQKGIEL